MAFCPSCGQSLPDSARFCPACGVAAPTTVAPISLATVPTKAPTPSARNPNAGCGKVLLWVGGVFVLLIAGCAAFDVMIWRQTEKAVTHSNPPSRSVRSRKAQVIPEATLDKASLAKLTAGLENVNSRFGEQLFSGSAEIGKTTCKAQVDGNDYEVLSDQDKRIVTQIVGTLCVAAYRAPYSNKHNVRSLPDAGLFIEIDDLSGHEVASDLWTHE
jgi:zinc-ribbon domain